METLIRTLLAVLALSGWPAFAQAPQPGGTPLKLIVPFTPGTGIDIVARTVGPRLSQRFKVRGIERIEAKDRRLETFKSHSKLHCTRNANFCSLFLGRDLGVRGEASAAPAHTNQRGKDSGMFASV